MPVTQDNKNWSRYGLALCTEGRDALACVFMWLYKGGFPVTVSNVNLFDQEKTKLQDSTDAAAFDIPLLYKLLRRVCGLADIKDPTWTTPGPSGPSLEHLIYKLLELRHNKWAHINKMTRQDLEENLTELRNILKMMLAKAGARCGKDSREVDRMFRNFTEYIDALLENIREPVFQRQMGGLTPLSWEDPNRLRQEDLLVLQEQDLNQLRYEFAVIKAGRLVLDTVFRWSYRGTFPVHNYLTEELGYNSNMYWWIFSNYQQNKLQASDSTGFDIFLLYKLLQHVCGLANFADRTWTTPGPSGPSLEHLIYKLEQHRNYAAHGQLSMTEQDFKPRLKELKDLFVQVLTQAGGRFGRTDNDVSQVINSVTVFIDASYTKITELLDPSDLADMETTSTNR
nr:uncharacterized protein LOC123770559 [Procambarus clarkii]XP_045618538.1 uncharacterized protein LOC123770559 [Procambarus clarkii]XP_045618539.1 uncharacterized protein LOC123770559 [Procambarus clarkii]